MRVILLALDGFDENLFSLEEFSSLRALYKETTGSLLTSTIPYFTPTAFATMQTGKDTGKHGISGFTKFDGLRKSRVYSGSDIEEKTFYEILYEHGKKCFIMGMPYSYPPRIAGDIVFDWLSGKKALFHPSSLAQEFPGLKAVENHVDGAATLVELMEGIRKQTNVLLDNTMSIFRSRKYDFSFFYIPAVDRILHKIAVDIADGNRSKSVRVANETFESIDNCIKALYSELRSDESLMIMSDHGFTTYDQQFFINDWLKENGYAVYGSSATSSDDERFKTLRIPRSVGRYVRKHQRIRKSLTPLRIKLRRSLGLNISDSPKVNLDKSVAACFEPGEAGIYLNRQLLATEEIEDMKKEIIKKISSNGISAHDKYDLFTGPKLGDIADIYLTSTSCCFGLGLGGSGFERIRVGDHRREGILLPLGNTFEKRANAASLLDLAPTILHLLDVPVPSDMQGRVLSEIFSSLSDAALREASYSAPDQVLAQSNVGLNAEEEKLVEERLRKIGYT